MEVARATGREAAILLRRRIRGTLLRACACARTTDFEEWRLTYPASEVSSRQEQEVGR